MSATPTSFTASGPAHPITAPIDTMGLTWAALHDAAAVVARLAGIAGPQTTDAIRDFPAAMRESGGWREAHAATAIGDLAAIMEPGLAALLSIHSRGADAAAAARALWHEFDTAREALLMLVPPGEIAAEH